MEVYIMAINIRYTSNNDNDLKKIRRFRTQNDMLKKERNHILRLRHFVNQIDVFVYNEE